MVKQDLDMPLSSKDPKVSILCLTYNHERYIEQALDSMLLQEVSFSFEILVHDDASTDKTPDIIRKYQNLYPKIIKPILQKENQFSKNVGITREIQLPRAKGQYIALCEGDDYWTDKRKLQKQVDFLEDNPDYSVCFHQARVVYEDSSKKSFLFPNVRDIAWYSLEELLKTNYIPTNSVVYRKQSYKNLPSNIAPGDWYLHLYHAKQGKIKYMPEVMSVYRKHAEGIWWEYDKDRTQIWKQYGIQHLNMLFAVKRLFESDTRKTKIITDKMLVLLEEFIKIDIKDGSSLVKSAAREYPELLSEYVFNAQRDIHRQAKEINKLWRAINKQNEIIAERDKALAEVASSKVWKATRIIKEISDQRKDR